MTSSLQEVNNEGSDVAEGGNGKSKHIIPGKQTAKCFWAKPGGDAERVLRAMVTIDGSSTSLRSASLLNTGLNYGRILEASIKIFMVGENKVSEERDVYVIISTKQPKLSGVVEIIDATKNVKGNACFCSDKVYLCSYSKLSDSGVRSIANQAIADYVVHGKGWKNRCCDEMEEPQGLAKTITSRKKPGWRELRTRSH